ncbi:hypothetical protein EI555_001009, partial [Monodon monoceros]
NSLDRAQAAKNKGNKYFKAGKYEQAIQCYTEAISLCPTEKNVDLSTFYQNRAAAFEQLKHKHKSDKHLYEEYVEKPLKLVLKVGGNEVTELSTGSSRHDSSLLEDKNDHDKHKDRKQKKRKKGEKQEDKKKRDRDRVDNEAEKDLQCQAPVGLDSPPEKPLASPLAKQEEVEQTPLQEALNQLMRRLQRKDPSAFFSFPVTDFIASGYSMIIEHPMDFSTMKEKIKNNDYQRAKAHEKLDNKKECLEDVTAVCILEGFQNQQSMLLADKVLKLLGKEKAKEKYKFIKSYFSSFTDDIISQPMLKGEKSDEDKDKEGEALEVKENSGYLKAKQYMEEENYDKIISECSKEVDAQGKYMAEALLLRATFYLLIGNANAAKPDLDKVISLKEANVKLRANALIKRGSMYMQQQQPLLSTQDFNMAADIDPQNADVYHHRGQLKILLDQVEEAVADFDECIRLRPESALAQAQKCFALYRQAYTGNNSSQIQAAMKGFEEVIKKFPRCAEGYALYAQ